MKNQALIRGLINPGGCCGWEGELSPKALLLFVYKGQTTELLCQQIQEERTTVKEHSTRGSEGECTTIKERTT